MLISFEPPLFLTEIKMIRGVDYRIVTRIYDFR